MRIQSIFRLSLACLLALSLFSCNEKEEFTTDKLTDYVQLTPGKYITYRLDSLVFINFDHDPVIRKYQVKHVIDAQITDNLGRPSYRVYRYIRDSVDINSWTPAQAWVPNGTYFITPVGDQLEVVEDNLRFIKLHLPVRDGFSWKGNRNLPSDPYGPVHEFNVDDNMEDWDFFYDGPLSPYSYKNFTYADVLTVEQANEAFNVPVTLPASYGSIARSVEKYSKGIGLVYRQYTLYEYQPDKVVPGGPNYSYHGFGVTQWMIDHN